MEDLLISTLETLGFPVLLQGSILDDEPYPDSFFTFWETSGDGVFYDDDEALTVYNYLVNFYSTSPESCYTMLRNAKKLLRKQGFILSGDGYSVPSGKSSHDGRGIQASYLKNERNDL